VPDLFTHYVAARLPGTFVRDRRLLVLLILGTFLPDIVAKGLRFVLQSGDNYPTASHSIPGVILTSYLACLFVAENLRRPGFFLICAGGLIHICVDMVKDNMGVGAVRPFLPFSMVGVEFGWIDPENVVLMIPVDAALLAVVLLLERRRTRVQQ